MARQAFRVRQGAACIESVIPVHWKTHMARYGTMFKGAVEAQLVPPETSPIEAASQKIGISVSTLGRCRFRPDRQ